MADPTLYEPPARIGTPEKRAALVAFVLTGSVTAAMQAIGGGRRTWYNWREQDPDFNQAAEDADEAVADRLEAVALDRATRAENASDTLLIFLLKGKRPEKYRERYHVEATGKDGGPIQIAAADVRQKLVNRIAGLGVSIPAIPSTRSNGPNGNGAHG